MSPKLLGAQIDLRQSGDLLRFVSNTAERVGELIKEIDDVLKSKLLAGAGTQRQAPVCQLPSVRQKVQETPESVVESCDTRQESPV